MKCISVMMTHRWRRYLATNKLNVNRLSVIDSVDLCSTMTSNYRPNESKREEFRRYLEKGGVVDAITRSFIMHFFSFYLFFVCI